MSNGIALRIAIFGGVALVLFAILFFRLWFLQILNGEQVPGRGQQQPHPRVPGQRPARQHPRPQRRRARRQPDQPRAPGQPAEAARRRGAQAGRAEPARRARPTRRCRSCGGRCTKELKLAPGAPVTLRRDVGNYLVYYLEENQNRFPGVDVERVFVRRYPKETFAAHILGSVGEVDRRRAEEPRYKGLEPGDEIGQDGVEDTYDDYLRGKPGADPDPGRRASASRPRAASSSRSGRCPGDNLKLTIDADVQAPAKRRWPRAGLRGRLRDDGRPQRRNPRHGLVPDLRPDRLHAGR